MRFRLQAFSAVACLVLAASAWGQGLNVPVFQSGLQTPRHAPMFLDNGVIGDSGPAGGGALGAGLSELNITNTGTPFCINDVPVTDPGGYHQLCLGASFAGKFIISMQSYAGAPAQNCYFNINGAETPCVSGAAGLPTVPGNTALRALASNSAPLVIRLDYETGYGSPPIYFSPSSSPCPSPIGDDGGSCVAASDGGSWHASPQNPGMDLRQFGAKSDGSADVSAAFLAASNANCGGSLYIAAGNYRVDSLVTLTCGVGFVAAPGAVIVDNTGALSSFVHFLSIKGTEGDTTPLTGNGTIGSLTVAVTSAVGWTALAGCAGLDGVTVHPGCAARIASTDKWDPTVTNHSIGEIKLVCQISGNTLTLCDPLEDTYNTASSAVASPIAMISGFSWTGGTFQGPATDNGHAAIYLRYAYFPTVQNTTFTGFAGYGDLIFSDSWYPSDLNTTFIGLAATSVIGGSYAAVDEDATEYTLHSGLRCYRTGPCYTVAYDLAVPSSPRHTLVVDSYAENVRANNSYVFQTHSAGADIRFFHNTVIWDNTSSNSHCFAIGVPFASIVDNRCSNTLGYGVDISNFTTRSGTAVISGNIIDGALICVIVQQGPASSTGAFTSAQVIGNLGTNCQHNGILISDANASDFARLVVANNEIVTADVAAAGYPAVQIYVTGGGSGSITDMAVTGNAIKATAIATSGNAFYLGGIIRGNVTGNTADGTGGPPGGQMIEGFDVQYVSFVGNSIKMPSLSTGAAIYLTNGTGSCRGNIVNGNTVNDPSTVSGRGFLGNNCSNTVVADNNFLESATRVSFVGGSGNQSEDLVSIASYLGVDPTGATDSSVGFQTALLGNCGGTVTIPSGTYKFTAPIVVTCTNSVIMDPNAAVSDQRAVPGVTPLVLYTGSIGTAVTITVDVAAGATSATVSSASSFCQPSGKAPDPNCAVFLRDEEVVDVASGSPLVHKGEIRLIASISGNVITFFGPTDDSYPVASTAMAQPVVLLDSPTWTGGKFIGPNANNGNVAFQYAYAYHPEMRDTVFAQFGQTGVYWQNTVAELEDHTSYIGLGANNASFNNQGSAVMDASNGGIHTHIQCLEGVGPCVTMGQFGSPGYGVNRHIQVIANYSRNALNLNDTQVFQTHFGADDIAFIDNTIVANGNSPTDNSGISLGGASGLIMGNRIIAPLKAAAIQVANGTIYDAHVTVANNVVLGANKTNARCIYVINEQALSASVGTYQDVKIIGNSLSGCNLNGIRIDGDIAGTNAPATLGVVVSNNNITSLSGATNNCIYLKGAISRFAITGNTCRGLSQVNTNAILLQDSSYGTVTGNYIELPASATGIGIRHNCTTASLPLSGKLVTDSGNVIFSPSGVSDTGIFVDNNCTSITLGDNAVSTAVTPRTLGTGTGNAISVPLNGVTGSIGGGALGAGACATGTVTIAGLTTAQKTSASASPVTYPGDTIYWRARVTGTNTVTVYVCSATGSTPTSSLYNVTVNGINN